MPPQKNFLPSTRSTTLQSHPLMKLLGSTKESSTASTAATTAAVTAAGATAIAATAKVASSASSATSSAFLGGALSGFVEKLLISPAKLWTVLKAVGAFALQDYKDWILIALCIFGPVPIARRFYSWRYRDLELDPAPMEQKFKFSKTRKVAQMITEVGDLFALLFGTELFLVFLKELGFKVVTHSAHTWATGIVATIWIAKNVSEFKRYLLSRANRKDLSQAAGARLINRFLDVIIVVATTLAILDFLSVKTGFALQSILGFSSLGTLVFSLASQNLASEFLASLAIQGTNMYQEGEVIILGDGTVTGMVLKLGWLNTHIRQGNDCIVRVPNTQIAGSRLANVSRQQLASVQVTLDISYQEISKLPKLVQQIKTNIVEELSTYEDASNVLVMDGSRPFRVHWREMTEWSVQVVIDTHLRVRPFSDEYWNLRQSILFAISKATEAHKIKFAYKDKNKMTPANTMPGLNLDDSRILMRQLEEPKSYNGDSGKDDQRGDDSVLEANGAAAQSPSWKQ
ncbi:mechanosensitive ion channel [Nitzschia inconspicua]|uniref:Mechanosensitive ion channel n=1 Tax=Nitzschia inconspicua TaxID=303405 RepID=A0A9K3K897_9STRA|nr:mechanosensitive ion channel [Nitzschia inconspicua]KAG7343567.1 mechanosensitive ion channel [Nitzschia inconspicua]